MKRFCNAFAVLMAALCTAGTASALPLVWRADWPDAKPVETLVHRGTDIELQPTWYINGELANSTNWTFQTFVQTNAQATGEWFGPLPGAFFSHTNDVGAAFYNVMVRAQMPGGGVNYTAFARLRMLDSPGFTPGELPLPVATIDFSKVVALHAPWALTNDVESIRVDLESLRVDVDTNSAAIATLKDTTSTLSAATATNSAAIATLKDTTATLSDSIAGKADATNIYTKAQMDAALDGKLSTSGGTVTGDISMVNGLLDAGDVQTRSYFDFRKSGENPKYLDAPENSGKALTDADISDSSSALGAALAGKLPSPTAPVASATLAWQSNGSAIVVSVGAAGTLSTTLTDWVDGQTQTALITLAAGASVAANVKLVGYGTWPTDGQFLASATRVGNFVYVTPIVLVN